MSSHSPRNRGEAVAFADLGKKLKFLFFWGHTAKGQGIGNECFSQWYSCRFEVGGITYRSAEHYMMAEKARLFEDEEHHKLIIESKTAGAAKALGRKVRSFKDSLWDKERSNIVVAGNMAKFGQNDSLREVLLQTKKRVLVEASPRDRIWGIGLGAANPKSGHPREWRGLNLLGFALMEVRTRLASDG